MTTQDSRDTLREVVTERAVSDPRHEIVVAGELVATLSTATLRTLAASAVAGELWSRRRRHVRHVESSSTRQAPPATPRPSRQADDFARLLEDPTLMYTPNDLGAWPKDPVKLTRRADRETFRRWAGDRFEEWHSRASDAAECVGDADLFHEHWHPDGPAAASRDRWVSFVRDRVEEAAQRERLNLTRELLNSTFALGDGSRTTWGSASVAEHEQRADLLIRNAGANAEAAVRHRAAVRMLRETGAVALSELAADVERGAA